uniref:Putative reverse transcriptase domain-containing protein n=1 Tax=Tanacetum cinerariifolium TaxID=118510 RepID=A0A6L2MF42_TANCI|nr:putative reverse transcriptase domain-containing protein [Tanacetum cinerariifolium]
MSMTIQSSVKDRILATPIDTSKVENAPAEMLHDLDQQMEKRADDGKADVVTYALSRKERVKPRRVRAMAMTIQYGVRGMTLAAQSEAFKQENVLAERLHGLDQQMKRKEDGSLYFMESYLVSLVESEMDETHASSKEWNSSDDQTQGKMDDLPRGLADAAESVRDAIGFESHVLWAEIRESSLTGLELVQETTDKVVLVKEKPKAARDRQKSYVDYRCKPLEFEGKLAPRYVEPFEILEMIGSIACRLRLPEELRSVHDIFHVSNLKKCLADANLHVSLDKIEADKTLHFVEETVGIMNREI